MQGWMIAMLVISALLIARDMAKVISGDRKARDIQIDTGYPQREQIEQYAASFEKLAQTFEQMPRQQEYLSREELEHVFSDVNGIVCSLCRKRETCWEQQQYDTYQRAYELLRLIEEGDAAKLRDAVYTWKSVCLSGGRYVEELKRAFFRARQNLIWTNRLLENRMAVAQQLAEVSQIMRSVAVGLFRVQCASDELREEIRRAFRRRHLQVSAVWVLETPRGYRRMFLTLRVQGMRCVTIREAAEMLSSVCSRTMVASRDGRRVIAQEYMTVLFQEDVSYTVQYGAARITKEKEAVSGDSYNFRKDEDGQFLMCLSDGMGSGIQACRESETVVELLEQFIGSGFSGETAARMINSALVLQQPEGMYSTVDICSLDLYTGNCDFLKAGASTTFIRHGHWVETVDSHSLAVGLVGEADIETTRKQLHAGDLLVMITDGVLDALPREGREDTMKEIVLQAKGGSAKEMCRGILEKALGYSDYRAFDDMTVLVAGIGRK